MRSEKKKDAFDHSNLNSAVTGLRLKHRAILVSDLEGKLLKLAGKHEKVMDAFAPEIRKRVEMLREIQSAHDELQAKFFEERVALEARHQKLYEPLYNKRFGIVNGVVKVEGATVIAPQEPSSEDKTPEDKGVPNFWLTAMKKHEVLAKTIQEQDEGALKYLKDIKWCRIDNKKGFKLEFFFNPNPYFKNSVLTKTYHVTDDDEPILDRAIGTEIEWFPGKCLTQKKGSKNAKPITKTEDYGSFFNLFNSFELPVDDYGIMKLDKDTVEQLLKEVEQDYGIGTTIRDKIIPNAVSWFSGEAVQEKEVVVKLKEVNEDDEDEEEDYNIGTAIHDTIIPNAVSWFTEEAVQDEDEEEYYDIGTTIRDTIILNAVSWLTGWAVQDEDDEDEEGDYAKLKSV